LKFAPRDPLVLSGGSDHDVLIWSIMDSNNIIQPRQQYSIIKYNQHLLIRMRFTGHTDKVQDVEFDPSGIYNSIHNIRSDKEYIQQMIQYFVALVLIRGSYFGIKELPYQLARYTIALKHAITVE
jgi:hypothetical protein